jgi:hypothetical protein
VAAGQKEKRRWAKKRTAAGGRQRLQIQIRATLPEPQCDYFMYEVDQLSWKSLVAFM